MSEKTLEKDCVSAWFEKGRDDRLAGRSYRKFSSIAAPKAVSDYWAGWNSIKNANTGNDAQ